MIVFRSWLMAMSNKDISPKVDKIVRKNWMNVIRTIKPAPFSQNRQKSLKMCEHVSLFLKLSSSSDMIFQFKKSTSTLIRTKKESQKKPKANWTYGKSSMEYLMISVSSVWDVWYVKSNISLWRRSMCSTNLCRNFSATSLSSAVVEIKSKRVLIWPMWVIKHSRRVQFVLRSFPKT